MIRRATNDERELAYRSGGGIDVAMHWNQQTNKVTVTVYDAHADEGFALEVDSDNALDAYHHPFAYLTGRQTRGTIAAAEGRTV
jgi:hypothetical protein